MINYNVDQYKSGKSKDKIEVACSYCGCINLVEKGEISRKIREDIQTHFCSQSCVKSYLGYLPSQEVACKNCGSIFLKATRNIKRSKNHFCSQSCAASYNNRHKTYGIRRSKLEIYLEEFLTTNYPNVKVLYNDKSIIGSELDFYFPDLKFAIELNGIVHYEPIYGVDNFQKVTNNDKQKVAKCRELGIELAVINSSKISYLTPQRKGEVSDILVKLLKDVLNRV